MIMTTPIIIDELPIPTSLDVPEATECGAYLVVYYASLVESKIERKIGERVP